MQATVTADKFREAVNAIMRFPQSSALAGSELIFFRVSDGKLQMYGGLSVFAYTSCAATGDIPDWYAVDGRVLMPYGTHAGNEPVEIFIDKKSREIMLRCGKAHESTDPVVEGPEKPPSLIKGLSMGAPSAMDVYVLNYLAALVPDMQTRADLHCVVIDSFDAKDGKKLALACGQRTVASASLEGLTESGKLCPTFARNVKEGELLIAASGGTTLKSKSARYSMPLPEETKNYPLESALGLLNSPRRRVAECNGDEFAAACIKSAECLGFITKTGAFVELAPAKNYLSMTSQSGSVTYRTRVDAKILSAEPFSIYIPVDDIASIAPLCKGQSVSFGIGKQHKELHIASDVVHLVIAAGKAKD